MKPVPIEALRRTLMQALELRSITGEDAGLLVDDVLAAEMEGTKTHGLGKFMLLDAAIADRRGSPEVIKQGSVSR